MNLKSMNQEMFIPTFFIQNNLFQKQSKEKGINIRKLASNLAKNFDCSNNLYAYIHNSVNREDELVEWHNKMQESMIGKNIYTREIAA